MRREGYLPAWFGKVDEKYGTPKNAIIFCVLVSLSGPILGREALGWFVDMSAIGASIGYFFTSGSTYRELKAETNPSKMLKTVSILGMIFSSIFIILQLIPIPGISGVPFGKESYIMLVIWTAMGLIFYAKQKKQFINNSTT